LHYLSNAHGADAHTVLTPISEDTGITIAQLNLGTGLMFLFLGWANLIWQPIALTYGRRGVYILSSFLCIWPVLWSAYSTSAGEWYAHRIILGIFAAPIESLPEVSVPDLFFAHNRGAYMGIYAFLLFGGNFLAPFLAGWIDVAGGWRWTMFFGALVQAVTTIIIFFWMEETMYFRSTVEGEEESARSEQQTPSGGSVQEMPGSGAAQEVTNSPDLEKDMPKKGADVWDVNAATVTAGQVSGAPKPFWKKLALFVKMPGRPSNQAMLMMMWRPLPIMWHFPSISWAGL
jgi:MFS family permease